MGHPVAHQLPAVKRKCGSCVCTERSPAMRQHRELWQTLHTAHESDSSPSGGHDDLRLVPSSICQIFNRRNCQIFGRRCIRSWNRLDRSLVRLQIGQGWEVSTTMPIGTMSRWLRSEEHTSE